MQKTHNPPPPPKSLKIHHTVRGCLNVDTVFKYCILVIFFLFFTFSEFDHKWTEIFRFFKNILFLLSHHLCQPLRHCSVPLVPASPTASRIQGSFCIMAAPPEVHRSTWPDWWAALQRRHYTAAESLWWCSVVPVLIEHMQDMTYYAPF